MGRIPKNPTAYVQARRHKRTIEEIQKTGPGPWVYVGDWPDEVFTTYWSPPWENSFTFVTGARVAFRHGLDGTLEFKGKYDLTAGAVSGDVAYTLPDDWLGETFDFQFPIELDAGVWGHGIQSVDGDTGQVRIYWPTNATALP